MKKNKNLRNITVVLSAIFLILLFWYVHIIFSNFELNGNSIKSQANSIKINQIKNRNLQDLKNPKVLFQTNYGNFTMELFLKKAPIAVNNFEKLIKEGFYTNIKFHRVIKGFMIQAGDPYTKNDSLKFKWGTGGPGYTIKSQYSNGLKNTFGTVAMAHTLSPNSAGSQFYINLADNSFLNNKYTVFGQIIDGINVIQEIGNVKVENIKTGPQNVPIKDVIIQKVIIFNSTKD